MTVVAGAAAEAATAQTATKAAGAASSRAAGGAAGRTAPTPKNTKPDTKHLGPARDIYRERGLTDDQVRHELQRDGFALPDIHAALRGEAPTDPKPDPDKGNEDSSPKSDSKSEPSPKPSPSRGSSSSGLDLGTSSGVVLAIVAYPAFLAYMRHGPSGLKSWAAAKFLNRTPGEAAGTHPVVFAPTKASAGAAVSLGSTPSAASITQASYSGGKFAGSLGDFGRAMQAKYPGVRCSEHPEFGGVTAGAHVAGSDHYRGMAIDVNADSAPGGEKASLIKVGHDAEAAGFYVLYNYGGFTPWPNHFNHMHISDRRKKK